MNKLVLGVFTDRNNAQEAIYKLESRGYNPKDISIVIKDREEARDLAEDTGAGDVIGGTAAGVTTGAILGGLAGLLAATVIPGLGTLFIGGPIAAALGLGGAAATTVSGVISGAAAGGLVGALTSAFGLSTEDARRYEENIKEGGILVAVPAMSGDEYEVKSLINDLGAQNVKIVENMARRKERDYDRKEDYGQYAGMKGGEARNEDMDEPEERTQVKRVKKTIQKR